MKKYNVLALGGVIGSVIFTTAVIVCGALRKNYSHTNQYMSELGEVNSHYSALMNIGGFIPAGLMFISFSISIFLLFPKTISSIIGSFLMAIFGVGMVLDGFYSCDKGCASINISNHQYIHSLVTPIGFVSGVVAIIFFGFSFIKNNKWNSLSYYSFLSGALALLFLLLVHLSDEARVLTGLWQRCSLGLVFLWCSIVSIKLNKFVTVQGL